MPSIYDYNLNIATEQLTPPNKRLPKWLAYFGVFDSVIQRYHDLVFDSYASGDATTDWVSAGTYAYLARARYGKSVYEMITVAGITAITTPPPQDTTNWRLVLNNFIGARERVSYTSSKISVEYALNRYFKVGAPSLPFTGASQTTQIWISNTNNVQSNFWLSNGGSGGLISYMGNSTAQRFFLGNAYSYNSISFTIHVPLAVFNALGPDNATREGIIRSVADLYVQCGKTYEVVTY